MTPDTSYKHTSPYRQYPTRHVYIPDRWWDRALTVSKESGISVSQVLRDGIDSIYRLHTFGYRPTETVTAAADTVNHVVAIDDLETTMDGEQ